MHGFTASALCAVEHECSRSLYAVLCVSVMLVCPTWRLKFLAMFLCHLVCWPSVDFQVKFCRDRPRGTPPSGALNARGVAEYSDFKPIERYISETVQDRS